MAIVQPNGAAGFSGMSFTLRPNSNPQLMPLDTSRMQSGGGGGYGIHPNGGIALPGNGMAAAAGMPPSRQSNVVQRGSNMMGRTGNLNSTSSGGAVGVNEADNIKVAIRVRPLFPKDMEGGATNVLQVSDDHTALKVVVGGPAGTSMSRDFQFHACLGPQVAQKDVLHMCGVPQLLEAALAGYNVTIFAYGQTGSGKTYTMSGREEVIKAEDYDGDPAHDGIVTRAVAHLFEAIARKKGEAKYTLSSSYLEIYNEQICDLLNLKQKNMAVKWEANQGFYVPGLKTVVCSDLKKMHEVLSCGMKHRHVGSHELNKESSRSHSILTIHCSSAPLDTINEGPRQGKISFVDLAGSERLKDSKSDGSMLKETANINKSLFVLGKVISALADKETSGQSAHIPYRDSKLTKLLMDSLGGSALALMIACCSPSSSHVEETLSTLTYATRAKNIQNRPTIQYDPREAQIVALRREIDLLRQENSYLRDQVRFGGGPPGAPLLPPSSSDGPRRSSVSGNPVPHFAAEASNSSSGGGGWGGQTAAAAGGVSGDIVTSSSSNPQRRVRSGDALLSPAHHHQQPPPPLPLPMRRSATTLQPSPGDSGDIPSYRDARYSSGGTDAVGPSGLQPPPGYPISAVLRSHSSPRTTLDLEPMRQSMAEAYDGGAFTPGSHNGAPRRLTAVSPPDPSDDLLKRLKETQILLSRFSEENSRLARDNDKLRTTRQVLSAEHSEVLDEIESLRSKLDVLQTSVKAGVQTPNGARSVLDALRVLTPGGSQSASSSAAAQAAGLNAVLNALNAIPSTLPPVGINGTPPTSAPRQHQPPPSHAAAAFPGGGASDLAQQLAQQIAQLLAAAPPSNDPPGASGAPSPTAHEVLAAIPSVPPDTPGFGAPLHNILDDVAQVLTGAKPATATAAEGGGDDGGTIQISSHFKALLQGTPPANGPPPPAGGTGAGFAAPMRAPQPPPQPAPAGHAGGGGGGGVANVMTVGVGGSAAVRTRAANSRPLGAPGVVSSSGYGASNNGGGASKGDDSSIIVADKAKLSLLLGFGSAEEPHPLLRPVPIKPPSDQMTYASAAKQRHHQDIQRHVGIDE